MAIVLPSAVMDSLVTHLQSRLDVQNVTWPPPDQAPAQLAIWMDYGPVTFEWGLLVVPHPQIVVTVAAPSRGGNYPAHYRTVTDMAHRVAMALTGQFLIAEEATVANVEVSRAGGAQYAGTDVVAATVTVEIEMKEANE
jgi:hypothetical protein